VRFFFVGIFKCMDESWRLLAYTWRNVGWEIPAMARVPYHNISDKRNESLSWLHARDEVGGRVLASVKSDRRLYQWARCRFERKFKATFGCSVGCSPTASAPEAREECSIG
jgi:hypothetical protein